MALYFLGNSYCRTISNFQAPTIGTVTGWFYPVALGGNQRIVGYHDRFEIRLFNTTLYHEFGIGGNGLQTGVVNNTIYNFACRYNNISKAGNMCINGISVASRSDGYQENPRANLLSIGVRTGSSDYFNGVIEDVRIYNRWLSDNEIETIYNLKGVDNIFDGLIHRWILNNGDENTIASEAGSVKDIMGGLHCTPYNNPTYILSPNKYKRALA